MCDKKKEISLIVNFFLKKGWKIQNGKKHKKLVSPLGSKVTLPTSPSDIRAAKNLVSQLRRKELFIS